MSPTIVDALCPVFVGFSPMILAALMAALLLDDALLLLKRPGFGGSDAPWIRWCRRARIHVDIPTRGQRWPGGAPRLSAVAQLWADGRRRSADEVIPVPPNRSPSLVELVARCWARTRFSAL
jgi:hypothetical protein